MALKAGDYPWIIIDANKDHLGKQKFVCRRCGQKHVLTVEGMSIDSFLKYVEAFCELHKFCPPDVPWIVNGRCVKKGYSICNIGYACDGCPYNKERVEMID